MMEQFLPAQNWQKLLVSTVYLSLLFSYNANFVERTWTVAFITEELNQPDFLQLIRRFLHDQLYTGSETGTELSSGHSTLPHFHGKVSVYFSAVSTFHAPSDISGIGGMRRERIRATPSWNKGPPRYDCVLVNTDPATDGFLGLDIARVHLFFSIDYCGITYPCALVRWMSRSNSKPDEDTGMWVVEPDFNADGSPSVAVIHLECILRAAHLIGVCGNDFLPKALSSHHSLDAFLSFYVNKFIDHHAFEIAF